MIGVKKGCKYKLFTPFFGYYIFIKFICSVRLLKIIIPIVLIIVAACNNSGKIEESETSKLQEKTNPNWSFQENDKYQFSYPKNWELVDDGTQGTAFIVVSQRVDSNDIFSESVNLVTQNVGETSLKEYVALSEQQIEEYMEDSEIIKREKLMQDSIEFHSCIFKATDQGTRFVFQQKYAIKNGIAYILTYTAEDKNYENMKPLADVVINSFKLK
jgi:hypothetical protein